MIARRVTIYDIARKIGVSHSTVALALRNHHRISEKRRQQVVRVAAEMGYAPDPLLAVLASYRLQIRPAKLQSAIIWLNHWEQPERLRKLREFDAYWRGAEAAARRFGYRLEEIRWEPEFSARRFEQIFSAAAVVVCGYQELEKLGAADVDIIKTKNKLLQNLCAESQLNFDAPCRGILRDGQAGQLADGSGRNAYTSWGDYYLMEALDRELHKSETWW